MFPVHESLQLQFRAELFDVLNHTNFGDPQQTQTNSSFGSVTSTLEEEVFIQHSSSPVNPTLPSC